MAQAAALARALDEPGHVGHGERRVAGGHHTEVGHQRRERVVGDLRPRPRERRDQARLAGAREPDQADVGDDLELEGDRQVVAGLAEKGEAGGLALGRGQRGVAQSPTPALGDDHLGAGPDEVGQDVAVPIGHHGAVGHREDQVSAVGAVAVVACAVAAVLASAVRAVVVVDERRDVGVDAQDHAAAGTAVAAVRPAERLELLAVHRRHAVATTPGGDVQHHAVDEGGYCHGSVLTSGLGGGLPRYAGDLPLPSVILPWEVSVSLHTLVIAHGKARGAPRGLAERPWRCLCY